MNIILLPQTAFTPHLTPNHAFLNHISLNTQTHSHANSVTDWAKVNNTEVNKTKNGNQPFFGGTAVINDTAQINHIKQVLGSRVGDTLKIGMCDGKIGTGVIHGLADNAITLSNICLHISPPSKLALTVVLAIPRPKVLRRLIIDMTAMGVAQIVLVNSYNSEKSYWQSPLLKRLDEFVQEGLQQAGDTQAPKIMLKKRFKPFVEDELAGILAGQGLPKRGLAAQTAVKKEDGKSFGVVAHPYAPLSFADFLSSHCMCRSAKPVQQQLNNEPLANVQKPFIPNGNTLKPVLPKVLCVGAEGGWIDYEVELLQAHGCQPVSLGNRILRTEAAVNALLGQWLMYDMINV